MSRKVQLGFLLELAAIPIANLVPTKPVTKERRASEMYKKVAASVKAEGLSEAPVVARDGRSSRYFILDGHVRVEALKETGVTEVLCLISTDDEGYTYNQCVSRISPVQANRMITNAIANGVSEERIAKALNLSVSTIQRSRTMLQGICPEAVELLKDKHVAHTAFELMKRVKPLRQIAMAELMNASKIYSGTYARALFVATPESDLLEFAKKRHRDALSAADVAKIEDEQRTLERDYVALTESYGENMMELTLACQYLKKLFASGKVVRYLTARHPDEYAALVKIIEAAGVEQ